MTRPGRTAATYARYRQSPRKQKAWSAGNAGNQAIREELVAAAWPAVQGAASVLDVGCGTGWWPRRLVALGVPPAALCAVDLLPERVAAAGEAVPGARVEAADARALPFPDGTFEAVTLLVLLSSLPDRDAMRAALAEARRVVAPGGVVVVWDVVLPNVFNRATRTVPAALVDEVLGRPASARRITLLPPLARRLGRATGSLYPALARVPPLCSHRLAVYRNDQGPALNSRASGGGAGR